jgi:hypothetical protein
MPHDALEGKPMKLYHFTRPSLGPRILREGLRAQPAGDDDPVSGGRPCVWFYEMPERPLHSEAFARKYSVTGYQQNLADRFLRLDVTIAKNDPRLCNAFLYSNPSSNGDPLWDECLGVMRLTWLFFSDVKPKNIRMGLLERPHPKNTELVEMYNEELKAMGVDPSN